jgi:hypothetical protein
MKDKLKNAINNFTSSENNDLEFEVEKKKLIKSDNSLIERFDKIIIDESGRQLLREQY